MGYCFYKYGRFPSEYKQLNETDKILMLAALEYFSKKEEKAIKK